MYNDDRKLYELYELLGGWVKYYDMALIYSKNR